MAPATVTRGGFPRFFGGGRKGTVCAETLLNRPTTRRNVEVSLASNGKGRTQIKKKSGKKRKKKLSDALGGFIIYLFDFSLERAR